MTNYFSKLSIHLLKMNLRKCNEVGVIKANEPLPPQDLISNVINTKLIDLLEDQPGPSG